ncbi:MAG: hypothetical protein JST49_04880, partial [Bacteroidetes bacterium]|nr:hypothetical protein [Bacteroidota bacterium]
MLKLKLLACLLSLTIFCRAQQQTTNLIYNNSFEYINSASPTYYEYAGGAFGLTDTSYKTSGLSCWVDAGYANGISVY